MTIKSITIMKKCALLRQLSKCDRDKKSVNAVGETMPTDLLNAGASDLPFVSYAAPVKCNNVGLPGTVHLTNAFIHTPMICSQQTFPSVFLVYHCR